MPTQQNQHVGTLVGTGILIVCSLVVLFYVFKGNDAWQVVQGIQKPQQSLSEWKTYTSNHYGFEVKHPEGSSIKPLADGIEIVNVGGGSTFFIGYNGNLGGLTLDEWFQKETIIGGKPTLQHTAKPIIINGAKAYRLDSDLPAPNTYFEIVGIANSRGSLFSMHAYRQVAKDAEALESIRSSFTLTR